MAKYLGKRLLQSLIAILGITIIVFLVLNIAGDPVALMLPETASFEEIAAMREKMGYNDPIFVQYFRFLGNALHGDFGMSYNYGVPALQIVLESTGHRYAGFGSHGNFSFDWHSRGNYLRCKKKYGSGYGDPFPGSSGTVCTCILAGNYDDAPFFSQTQTAPDIRI